MHRLSNFLVISAMLAATSGCVASRGYVRNSVKASSDALTARIETNESNMKEIRDTLDRKISDVDTKVSGVDSKVSALDSKTTEGMNSLKGDVQNVDQRAGQARSAADRANNEVSTLGQKFQNRNMFNVSNEKTIQFKFDRAKLDEQY